MPPTITTSGLAAELVILRISTSLPRPSAITLTSMTSRFGFAKPDSLSAVSWLKLASTTTTAPDALLMPAALIVEIAPSFERSNVPFRLIVPPNWAEPPNLSVAPVSMVRFLILFAPPSVPPVPETVMSSFPEPPSTVAATVPPPLMTSRSSPGPKWTGPRTDPPWTFTVSFLLPVSKVTLPRISAPLLTVTVAFPLLLF